MRFHAVSRAVTLRTGEVGKRGIKTGRLGTYRERPLLGIHRVHISDRYQGGARRSRVSQNHGGCIRAY